MTVGLFKYLVMAIIIVPTAILVLIAYYGYVSWEAVIVPVLVGLVVSVGRWAQVTLQKREQEEKELIKPVYAPLYEDLKRIVAKIKKFRPLDKAQEQAEEWGRVKRERNQYSIPDEFRKKLQDFYEEALPSYVQLFSEARKLATRIVMEDLRARGRIQKGGRVSIRREDRAIETMTFESWLEQDARRFSDDVPVESIFMPIDRLIIPYETTPKYLERDYARVQQVFDLPANFVEYVSELRTNTLQREDVQQMLKRQQEAEQRAQKLLADLKKKAKA